MYHKPLMKSLSGIVVLLSLLTFISCLSGNQQINKSGNENKMKPDIKRVGMVIKIDSSRIKEYLKLHADSNPGVRDLLSKYHIKNFSIFLTKLDDGNYYEFGYYEYTGTNYESDMAGLDAEPRNKEWLKICDPMQIPLKGEKTWKKMEQIYFNR